MRGVRASRLGVREGEPPDVRGVPASRLSVREGEPLGVLGSRCDGTYMISVIIIMLL